MSEGGDIKADGQYVFSPLCGLGNKMLMFNRPTKAGDFARGGVGAPEARDQKYVDTHGGDDAIRGNIRN